ncbi:MAG: flagellar basal-body rod protein FlgG [Fimbriiglobus sp.]|jgi:flagellar basal-body rod protein FlgG|nr:flagellar basal-body rod protein FlgG [Fimbriiglobus sp.]
MIRALYTSATGMNVQATTIDNTANNLANVNTNGFKKGQADFQDLIYTDERSPGGDAAQGLQLPTGLQIGHGARVASITKVFTPGTLFVTGNPYDLAIDGQGFLQVLMPNGETRYTRDGALRLNPQGNLVTTDGFLVTPQVTIPQDAVSTIIGADGTVAVKNAQGQTSTVGQLTLVRFPNPAGLSAEGRNLYTESASSGPPLVATPGVNGTGLIRQSTLERSNVDPVTELVTLILAQRAYEFNTRSVRTADNMMQATTELIR